MPINLSDDEEERICNLFLRIFQKLEDGHIDKSAAMATCLHTVKLVSNQQAETLRTLLYQEKALEKIVFQISSMPATRKGLQMKE